MKHDLVPILSLYEGLEALPIELVLFVLQLSGHVRKGNRSVSFLVYF